MKTEVFRGYKVGCFYLKFKSIYDRVACMETEYTMPSSSAISFSLLVDFKCCICMNYVCVKFIAVISFGDLLEKATNKITRRTSRMFSISPHLLRGLL